MSAKTHSGIMADKLYNVLCRTTQQLWPDQPYSWKACTNRRIGRQRLDKGHPQGCVRKVKPPFGEAEPEFSGPRNTGPFVLEDDGHLTGCIL